MPAMTKIVNIRTRVAVKNITPPICGTVKGIVMTTGDILKCLCKRAQVEEVLPDGTTVKLNMSNYYTDNGAGLVANKNLEKPEKKPIADIERFKVPVSPVEETEKQVVETMTDNNEVQTEPEMPETVNLDINNADDAETTLDADTNPVIEEVNEEASADTANTSTNNTTKRRKNKKN